MEEHILLRKRNKGVNRELKGYVLLLYVLVNTPNCRWTETQKAEMKATALKVDDFFEKAAASYAANLKIDSILSEGFCDTEIKINGQNKAAAEKILKSMGWENAARLRNAYKERYKAQEVAICFVLPERGRSFAASKTDLVSEEYAYVFGAWDVLGIVHEVCHLFGAVDFYFPPAVTKSFEKNIGKSVMLADEGACIDEVTAYLIGWKKALSSAGLRFFQETAHITVQDLIDALEVETSDEPGTITYADGTVYIGERKAGLRHGHGTLRYKNGNVFEGEFKDSVRSGWGRLRYKNGDMSEGCYKDDKLNGPGTYKYKNGGVYTGMFKDGLFSGHGKFISKDGAVYEGEFKEDKMNGSGTYIYKDGSVYTGMFKNGMPSGRGTLKYKSGNIYEGEFKDGKCNGRGTLRYKNGNVYEGEFKNDKPNGRGRLRYKSGHVYEGDFIDGQMNGRGVFRYKDGDVYEGEFIAGQANGRGVFMRRDGTVIKGLWCNGTPV